MRFQSTLAVICLILAVNQVYINEAQNLYGYGQPIYHRHPVVGHSTHRNVAHVPRNDYLRPRMQPPRPILYTSPVLPTVNATSQPQPGPFNLDEVCANYRNKTERQLMAYISGIDAITGTIQELDEVMQQWRPRSCDILEVSTSATTTVTPTSIILESAPTVSDGSVRFESTSPQSANLYVPSDRADVTETSVTMAATQTITPDPTSTTSTTESFTDPPVNIMEGRVRRESNTNETPFGLPTTSPSSNQANQDQANEDLVRASNDLKALRKDLSTSAELLKQTNHTVHSAMLRALQAYVSSIERRVDHQRQVYAQTSRSTVLKSKVAVIKEKVANLLDKLKSLIPFKQNDGNPSTIDRIDDQSVPRTTPTSTSATGINSGYRTLLVPSTTVTTNTA